MGKLTSTTICAVSQSLELYMNLICSGSELKSLPARPAKGVSLCSSTSNSSSPLPPPSSPRLLLFDSQRFPETQHNLTQLPFPEPLWELFDPGSNGCGSDEVGDEGEGVTEEREGGGCWDSLERTGTEEVEEEEVESESCKEGVEESGRNEVKDHFGRMWLGVEKGGGGASVEGSVGRVGVAICRKEGDGKSEIFSIDSRSIYVKPRASEGWVEK